VTLRILMFGRSGQVATEVQRLASDNLEIKALSRDQMNLSKRGQCATAIDEAAVDVVINAAAFTAVDAAETNEEVAIAVNAHAPGEMAQACALRDIPFVHISSDYVFDGSKDKPWSEDDFTAPLNTYGRSKLLGEQAVRDAGGRHVILRTSWIYSAHGENFVKTMLKMLKSDRPVAVISDQYGGPTSASDVASALVSIAKAFNLKNGVTGTFHYCGAPAISWHGFAEEVFNQAKWLSGQKVQAISSSDRPTLARRPHNSVLDCTKTEEAYDIVQPDWRKSLSAVLDELKRQEIS